MVCSHKRSLKVHIDIIRSVILEKRYQIAGKHQEVGEQLGRECK